MYSIATKIYPVLISLGIFMSGVSAQNSFSSLAELMNFAEKRSVILQSNYLKVQQAKQAKIAAILGIPDVSANVNGSFMENTKLPVTILPSSAFGGQEGEVKEISMGSPYQTSSQQNIDVKLINAEGWKNLKLAKLNMAVSETDVLLNKKALEESIAATYFNILQLQDQLKCADKNYLAADTIHSITLNKYNKGLVKQQEVNDSKVNVLNMAQSKNNIVLLIRQAYTTLKILADIPETESIFLSETLDKIDLLTMPSIQKNELSVLYSHQKEKYALHQLKKTNYSFFPTLSFFASNSYNAYNQSYTVFDGNFINSNYLGLRLNWNLPNAQMIANRSNAKFSYLLSQKATLQSEIKAGLDATQLSTSYAQSLSVQKTNTEIEQLQFDTYVKNKNIYQQGLLSLDRTILSFTNYINAQYSTIQSKANMALSIAKININNKYKKNEK
jgi:outer membrane protein TolC